MGTPLGLVGMERLELHIANEGRDWPRRKAPCSLHRQLLGKLMVGINRSLFHLGQRGMPLYMLH